MNPPPPRGAAGPPDDTAPPRAEQSRRRLRAAARRRGAGDGRSLPPTAQRHRHHHRRSSCAAATVSRSGATPPLAPDLLLKHPALELVASASQRTRGLQQPGVFSPPAATTRGTGPRKAAARYPLPRPTGVHNRPRKGGGERTHRCLLPDQPRPRVSPHPTPPSARGSLHSRRSLDLGRGRRLLRRAVEWCRCPGPASPPASTKTLHSRTLIGYIRLN